MLRIVTGLAAVMVGLAGAGVASGLYREAHGTITPPASRPVPAARASTATPYVAPVKHRLATAVKFQHGYYYPGKDHAWSVEHYEEQLGCTVYWCPLTHDWYFWSERLESYLPTRYWTADGGSLDGPRGDKDVTKPE